ncbi:septum formation family protein [Micromonospora sp. WMMD737]|uniref:septum formation family protein n=1 Tax=Micromonospora sp. WMMD737 TaxID=3404113 RepID=UPI003B9355DF
MRRWLAALALAGTLTVLLSGCVRPGGSDGDLTDDWPALRAPQLFVPATDACLPRITAVVQARTYEAVDCSRNHLAETVHVGRFAGPTADGDRPEPGSAALRPARAECDQRAREVLGGDWHAARVTLTVALPSAPAWRAGARWFRCDLSETGSIDNTRPVNRTGSLRGAMIGDSPLLHRCFDPKLIGDNLNYMAPVLCTEPHRAEFVGVYLERDMTWAEFGRSHQQAHTRCMALIAAFAEVPVNSDLPYRAGSIFYPPSQREWQEGDRGVRCFLWSDDRKLTRSMRGAGPQGLPAS